MRQSIVCAAILVWSLGQALAAEPVAPAGTSIENAFRGALQDRTFKSADEGLFVEKCAMCHRQMGMGTVILARRMPATVAVLESRPDLTADFVKFVARRGLGTMPHISRSEVDDAQLERIARYLSKGK